MFFFGENCGTLGDVFPGSRTLCHAADQQHLDQMEDSEKWNRFSENIRKKETFRFSDLPISYS